MLIKSGKDQNPQNLWLCGCGGSCPTWRVDLAEALLCFQWEVCPKGLWLGSILPVLSGMRMVQFPALHIP